MVRVNSHGAIQLCALLAVLAGMCEPCLAGRVAEDGVSLSIDTSYIPLAPWMEGVKVSKELPACVVFPAAPW